ncbi:hypothetical protein CEB3_c05250 [Peptococcaceae bacterium CEB3]|nr:hypothetical protein CEB3_c05250 [Peptococcaceae bacterium CEB3]
MRRKFLCVLILSLAFVLTACGMNPSTPLVSSNRVTPGQISSNTGSLDSQNQELDINGPVQVNPAPQHKPLDPKGMFSNDGGKTFYLSLTGLTVHTDPPTEGAAKVAWDFYSYQGKQEYDKALLCLRGHKHHNTMIYDGLTGKEGTLYLKEVIGANLIRWSDITGIVSKEQEDEGAYQYKVIYLELNLKLRGKLTKEETYMRNGLNCVAVHVIKEKEGDPWEIVLETGTPWMEK